jgi:hemerythrin superfamily protein
MIMLRSTHHRIVNELQYEYDKRITHLENAVELLRESLLKSKKNDTPKDAKTGRFVKK